MLNVLIMFWVGGYMLIVLILGVFSVVIFVIKIVVMMVLSLFDGGW